LIKAIIDEYIFAIIAVLSLAMILVPVIAYMQLEYLSSTDDINVATQNQKSDDTINDPNPIYNIL